MLGRWKRPATSICRISRLDHLQDRMERPWSDHLVEADPHLWELLGAVIFTPQTCMSTGRDLHAVPVDRLKRHRPDRMIYISDRPDERRVRVMRTLYRDRIGEVLQDHLRHFGKSHCTTRERIVVVDRLAVKGLRDPQDIPSGRDLQQDLVCSADRHR